ncbi:MULTISPECIES: hypothetical protein [Nostoc]|uniref:Uncharacterized protein n=1 Tax=Nostoc paludosum FACHB-159 TaxID=2692908 RepID=A0ABR8K4G8_9NOSO|nr:MULTISPECIES: hypothetical protein [Nostoc]MBD2677015.1 hypothetical protein [Nostoc sp. FACHB-857]MBD2733215.1 hypothetical protein [Nostoc paludosum FACHB-159]
MEPVSLIISALVTGAAETIGGNAFNSLKDLIKRKFADKSKAEIILARDEKQPEVWEESLRAELVKVGADQDEEILKKAKELLELVKHQEVAGTNKINIGRDAKGVIADTIHGNITQGDIS